MAPIVPELRVEIRKLGQRYFVITRHADGRELCTNEFQHDATSPIPSGPLWLLEHSVTEPAGQQRPAQLKKKPSTATQIAAVGRKLYGYLFGDGREVQKFLDTLPVPHQVCIALSLHPEAAELWRLPWEYLHNGQEFLCLSPAFSLWRVPEAPDIPGRPPGAGPLRILIVAPQPLERNSLDPERELAIMYDSLADAIRSGQVVLDTLYEATLTALADHIRSNPCHVMHYVGYGRYNQNQQRGFLCFEDPLGHTDLVSAEQVGSALATGPGLVVLSAARGAAADVLSAFDHVAPGLVRAGVASVIAVAPSLGDDAAMAETRALYGELARGGTLAEGVSAARAALKETDAQRAEAQRHFEWGALALYTRSGGLSLVSSTPPVTDTAGKVTQWRSRFPMLPPEKFVGRQAELRSLRAALREELTVFSIWGSPGIGKTALVAQALRMPSIHPDEVLVIHCQELYRPEDILAEIQHFWLRFATPEHRRAAELLVDSTLLPQERAQQAQQLLQEHRSIIVLDDLDAVLAPPCDTVSSGLIQSVLLGLLRADGKSTFILTGSYRCIELSALPTQQRGELHLPLLHQQHLVALANSIPNLRALSPEDKTSMYWHLGGNPKLLRLLSGWIASGYEGEGLWVSPPVTDRLAESWAEFFLDGILEALHPGEYEALTALAVLRGPICASILSKVTHITSAYAEGMLQRWADLALLEPHHIDAAGVLWYALHTWVHQHLLKRMSAEDEALLHANAVSYYSAPFVDETRRLLLQYGHVSWSEDVIRRLARDPNGVLGRFLHLPQDPASAYQALKRVLAWQYHLLEAGAADDAVDLARALLPELKRWGYRDLARALLKHCTGRLQDSDRYETFIALGGLDEEEGRLNQALDVYQEVNGFLAAQGQGTGTQFAYIQLRIADVYQRLGHLGKAISTDAAALQLMRECGDRRGELLCQQRLCRLHRMLGQNKQALVYSQVARELSAALGDTRALIDAIQEQGRIFSQMGHKEHALNCLRESLELTRGLGDAESVASQLEEVAQVERELGRPDAALLSLQQALAIHERTGRVEPMAALLRALGELYEQQGHLPQALESYARARRAPASRQRQGTT